MISQVTSVAQIDRFTRTVQGFLDNMTPLTTCEAETISQYGRKCQNKPTVIDWWSERELCAECFALLDKGLL